VGANFLHLATTPAVRSARQRYYGAPSAATADGTAPPPDVLGPEEREFITARDSFYLATISESGWPYVQHRGGQPGFLRVLGPRRLAFADRRGNRQMLSTGNLGASDRVALFLMDYPQRSRLKILGHARVVPAAADPDLLNEVAPSRDAVVERVMIIEVVAFDWNCPKYITPRYTKTEVDARLAPLHARIAELEGQLARVRA
jgi:predicted pyridoxine 5'-phosphate oxidase superfamily flavin-nucleotide-binding protein